MNFDEGALCRSTVPSSMSIIALRLVSGSEEVLALGLYRRLPGIRTWLSSSSDTLMSFSTFVDLQTDMGLESDGDFSCRSDATCDLRFTPRYKKIGTLMGNHGQISHEWEHHQGQNCDSK